MSTKGKTRANQLSCLVTISLLQSINYGGGGGGGGDLCMRAKTKANLKPKLKMKVS